MTPLSASQQAIQNVDRFTYLGSRLTGDGDVITDVNCLIGKTSAVFQHMRSIWSSPVINTNTKIWLFNASVLSVVNFASEIWKMTSRIAKKLDIFQQRCLRS